MSTLRPTAWDRFRWLVTDEPPAGWRPVPWKPVDILIAIAANIEIALLFYVIAAVLGLLHSPEFGTLTGILLRMGYHIAGLAIVVWLVRWRGGDLGALGFRPIAARHAYVPVLGFAAMLLIFYGYAAVAGLLGISVFEPQGNAPVEAFAGPLTAVLLVIRSVIVTPITEESLLRGFVFGGMRNHMPAAAAIIVSGVLFGLVHLSPGLMIPYALIGMLLAYMYASTGSIYTCIVAHGLFNAVGLAVAWRAAISSPF
jgi:membrane protease YdiL (CAAX protease family)